MDTPGVMLPNVPNEEVGMRLALTGNSLTAAIVLTMQKLCSGPDACCRLSTPFHQQVLFKVLPLTG